LTTQESYTSSVSIEEVTLVRSIPKKVIYHSWKKLQATDEVDAIPVITASKPLEPDEVLRQLNSKWNRYPRQVRKRDVVTLTCPNDPIKGMRLASVNERTFTCRATLTLEGTLYQAQIQTSTLLEIAQSVGIEKGGIISAPLVWANLRRHPYMRLVRIGSDAYIKHKFRDDKLDHKILYKGGLKPGHLYENLSGQQGIFVAHICTIDFPWQIGPEYKKQVVRWDVWKHVMLWYENWRNEESAGPQPWDAAQELTEGSDPPHFSIKRSHSYRIDLGKVADIDFEATRDIIIAHALHKLEQNQQQASDVYNLYRFGKFLNMAPVTEEPKINPQAKEVIANLHAVVIGPGTPIEELPALQAHENRFVREEAKRYIESITEGGK